MNQTRAPIALSVVLSDSADAARNIRQASREIKRNRALFDAIVREVECLRRARRGAMRRATELGRIRQAQLQALGLNSIDELIAKVASLEGQLAEYQAAAFGERGELKA